MWGMLSNVDFPEPKELIMATSSPSATEKLSLLIHEGNCFPFYKICEDF